MTVDTFRGGLDAETLATVDALRAIVSGAHDGLVETIKWNAPSFALGDEDRITFGLERKVGVRVVLHRGAKVKDARGFAFADPTGLAKWPAADRGVMVFRDAAAVEEKRDAVRDICVRWLAAG